MLIVDTNVLLDILENDRTWAEWSVTALRAQSQVHELVINPIIYAEVSLAFESMQTLDRAIETMGMKLHELPRSALFLAGRAFLKYRKLGGSKANVLADFFIGAHAAVLGCGIVTRDARRYASYFPQVPLLAPGR